MTPFWAAWYDHVVAVVRRWTEATRERSRAVAGRLHDLVFECGLLCRVATEAASYLVVEQPVSPVQATSWGLGEPDHGGSGTPRGVHHRGCFVGRAALRRRMTMSQRAARRCSRGKSAGASASSPAETPPASSLAPAESTPTTRARLAGADRADARSLRRAARLAHGFEDPRRLKLLAKPSPRSGVIVALRWIASSNPTRIRNAIIAVPP